MTINQIIKNTMLRIKEQNKNLTPDNYALVFCQEAKKLKILIEDCNKIDKYKKKLIPDIQKELNRYNLKDSNDLINFLITKVNRGDDSEALRQVKIVLITIKRILQVTSQLNINELNKISDTSLNILEKASTLKDLESIKEKWNKYLLTFNMTFLEKLSVLDINTSNPLEVIVKEIIDKKHNKIEEPIDKGFAMILREALDLSLFETQPKAFDTFYKRIVGDPYLIEEISIQKEFIKLVHKRIWFDQEKYFNEIRIVNTIFNKTSLELTKIIKKLDNSNQDFLKTKTELTQLKNKKTIEPTLLKTELLEIASSLEKQTVYINNELNIHRVEIIKINKEIVQLENDLKEVKEKSHEDHLTKLLNKKSLKDRIEWMEANYIQDKNNKYSLAIFNIDSLKNINDTYGYDAGDMIIQNFTSILKTTTRAIDFIAYIENKEFIVILPAVKINGAYTFADKIRRKVTQTKFKYKNTIIPITVSAGTSNRGSCSSLEATLKSANKYLHIAKVGGKNRVEPS